MGVEEMDCRNWDQDSYRDAILQERETIARTVFRTAFARNPNPNPNYAHIVTASSDGVIASYSISSCLVISLSRLLFSTVHLSLDLFVSLLLFLGGCGRRWDVEVQGVKSESPLILCIDLSGFLLLTVF